ncbi:translation initiation factor IF-2-like [Schistocerca serialis cubense]|uniref:translation initiation factor IF-2-like n=1 Tax=Schistocerca serialis cubense TaxID=2023355 RepID=UPI00214F2C3E|nr:translation initiation factor IF-2-like [Schistocerca serialis cubense]
MDSLNQPCPDETGGPSPSQHTDHSGSESDTSCNDELPTQGQSEALRSQGNDTVLSAPELEFRTPRVRSAKTAASETLARRLADTSESDSEKERKAKVRKQKNHLRKLFKQRSQGADAATEIMPPPRQPAPKAAPKAGDKPKPAQVAGRKPSGPVGDGATGKSEPKAKTKASRRAKAGAGSQATTQQPSRCCHVHPDSPGGRDGGRTAEVATIGDGEKRAETGEGSRATAQRRSR